MPRSKVKDYQQSEKDRKKAQGKRSTRRGNLNRTRIMLILNENPLTFTELQEQAQLSTPVLSNHLKKLRDENSIEKAVEEDKVVYKVISEEKVKIEVKAALFDLVANMLPFGIGDKIENFVNEFATAILEMGEEKAVEEKILKPLRERQNKEPDEIITLIESQEEEKQ